MIGNIQNHSLAESTTGYPRIVDSQRSDCQDASTAPTRREDGDQQTGDLRQLSEDEKRQVQQLKQRDLEVRAHESAHMAATAGLVKGGASFTFQRGPDGRMYAVGGEVQIDTSSERDPDQTIRKIQQVKQAALAPSDPSGTDRAVAAQASQVEAQARQEKNKLENVETKSEKPDDQRGGQASGGRRPYSVEAVGQALNIAV